MIQRTAFHVNTYQDSSMINASFKISAIGSTNREMPVVRRMCGVQSWVRRRDGLAFYFIDLKVIHRMKFEDIHRPHALHRT